MAFPTCIATCLSWKCGFEIFIGVILLSIHIWYCRKVQCSLDSDKDVKNHIVKQLNSGIQEMNVDVDLSKKPDKVHSWSWLIIQCSITFVLVLIFCISS